MNEIITELSEITNGNVKEICILIAVLLIRYAEIKSRFKKKKD